MSLRPDQRPDRAASAERWWLLRVILAIPAWLAGVSLLLVLAAMTYAAAWHVGAAFSQIIAGWAIGGLVLMLASAR